MDDSGHIDRAEFAYELCFVVCAVAEQVEVATLIQAVCL
jgi:hypothetical protein